MKLLRYGAKGGEKPGMLDAEGRVRALEGVVDDVAGATLTPEGLARLAALDPAALPPVESPGRLGPCVGRVGKILCIGLNYHDHAAEVGAKPPKEPILFLKATSALAGPNDPIPLPRGSEKTDWEVELGVVIGAPAKHVSAARALEHVAGYCVAHDVSERSFQSERGGQWTKGKSCDGFGPIGPWLVTRDEVPDPQALRLTCAVNGATMQDGTTADMIFGVAEIVSYLSDFMTLEPGDVIMTGTPAGVGLGRKPQTFLEPGDVVELAVEGLAVQRQEIVPG